MKSTKGAMELSVTAIVVLILAIVMLGLGLGFIRGMFSKVSTSFDEQISAEPEAPEATGSDPITLSRESIITAAGESLVLKVNVYNPTASAITGGTPTITCTGISFSPAPSANSKPIPVGGSVSYNVLISIPNSQGTGTKLCKVVAPGTIGNKDFTIEVR